MRRVPRSTTVTGTMLFVILQTNGTLSQENFDEPFAVSRYTCLYLDMPRDDVSNEASREVTKDVYLHGLIFETSI